MSFSYTMVPSLASKTPLPNHAEGERIASSRYVDLNNFRTAPDPLKLMGVDDPRLLMQPVMSYAGRGGYTANPRSSYQPTTSELMRLYDVAYANGSNGTYQ